MKKFRKEKAISVIKERLSELLLREIKDPRLKGFITVTDVELTNDLRIATVWVSCIEDDVEPDTILSGFESAKGFIRSEVANTLSLRFAPELRFKYDNSIKHGIDFYHKIDEIRKKDKERNQLVEQDED